MRDRQITLPVFLFAGGLHVTPARQLQR